MPTFLQWWGIMGEVTVLELLLSSTFCEDVRSGIRPHQHNARLSDRTILALASVVFGFVAAAWPVFVLRSWFK